MFVAVARLAAAGQAAPVLAAAASSIEEFWPEKEGRNRVMESGD
jgi:hypothetical protein